ncbi:RluA family pseudouridine synthase [Butyrivibrio sp. AE2032]|uniref:RluA family pseudouridine synthase n=1 Tax=Butyrivibrio sp. AE2032 TaxID=1458463 RepID=UPI0005529D91|nr:RluA family pseudouridine synthase [Butyrivibrio sp. AE2032]
MKFEYFVENEYNGCEIQQVMRRKFKMSTTWVKRVKLYGTVEQNGVHARVKDRVSTGDRLYFEYEDNSGKLNCPENVSILYETGSYAVVNKPAGMVTHPSHGHLEDSLLTSLSDETLHPVMRLDRETSGLLIVAKDGYAHNMLVTEADIKKSYLALCYGKFEPSEGTMSFPIARRENSVMIRDCVENGKPSVTHYKTVEHFGNAGISLVEFKLETGRCHQIRTHCCHVGHPLLGDGLYGPLSDDNPNPALKDTAVIFDEQMGRVALHAYKIEYKDPFDKEDKVFEAALPEDMQRVIDGIR